MRTFDPFSDYPLGTRRPDLVATPSGLPLEALTLAALAGGDIPAGDLRVTAATLGRQAAVALAAGRARLADNFERAAELTGVPDDLILEMYTALRPHRSSAAELEAWAVRFEQEHRAPVVARLIREAAAAYAETGLLA